MFEPHLSPYFVLPLIYSGDPRDKAGTVVDMLSMACNAFENFDLFSSFIQVHPSLIG